MTEKQLLTTTEDLVNKVHTEFENIIGCNLNRNNCWFDSNEYEITTPIIKSTQIYICTTGKIDYNASTITIITCVVCFGHEIDKQTQFVSFKNVENDDERMNIFLSAQNKICMNLERFDN